MKKEKIWTDKMINKLIFVAGMLFCCSVFSESVSPVPKTGQIISYRTGDDGDIESGVAWPNPRFTDNGDGTVLDQLTGLEWVKAPQSLSGNSGTRSWYSAINFCEGLSYATHDDWRLPSVKELESLVHCGKGSWNGVPSNWMISDETPFSGVKCASYWSGTSMAYVYMNLYAWTVSMQYGSIKGIKKNTEYLYAWPMRSRQ